MGDLDWLQRQILMALGSMSLVACGGQSERAHNGDSGGQGGSEAATVTASGANSATNTTGVGLGTGGAGGTAPSNGGPPAAGGTEPGVAACEPLLEPESSSDCAVERGVTVEEIDLEAASARCGCSVADFSWRQRFEVCVPVKPGLSCAEAYDPNCLDELVSCGLFFSADRGCGPLPAREAADDPACCYVLSGGCAVGRPFLVAGTPRLAALEAGRSSPGTLAVSTASLSESARAALADAYARDARTEHASIASFARFVLECLALGAPLELVQGAQQALADEVEHARLCLALAQAYGAPELVFGPLDICGAIEPEVELARVAEAVTRESCIAETVSAALLQQASEAAGEPIVRQLLARMAEDEIAHATLGFKFVRWALSQGDTEVRFRVERAFADAAHAVGFGARTELSAAEAELVTHGYLPVAERRRIAARALAEVVEPCARVLLTSAPSLTM